MNELFCQNQAVLLDEQPRHIGVLRMSAMGDCLMLLATLQRIKAFRPNWRITWLISKTWMPLFSAVKDIEFIAIDKPHGLVDYIRFGRDWRKKPFDILLCMQASLRANLLYLGLRSPLKLGFDKARAKDGHGLFVTHRIPARDEHIFEGFERFADCLGVPTRKPQWHLPLSEAVSANVQLRLDKLFQHIGSLEAGSSVVIINLAASKEERTPYESFYVELIKLLSNAYSPVIILVGGPSDWELAFAEALMSKLPGMSRVANWVGKTKLPELAALIAKSSLLVAPDSGPAHLANALGTPVIGLFAVAPPNLSAAYLWKDCVVNAYPEAVEKYLGKNPDQIKWATRVHERMAMTLIKPESVLVKLKEMIQQGRVQLAG